MKDIIIDKLNNIATTHGVKILYACESGSRAWGFASPDSDYDVRFIYVRPQNDYLSICDKKDVIELPVNEVLDIGGWDLRKALQLFLKSNAPLYEWLQSPVIYQSGYNFNTSLLEQAAGYFSPRAAGHHYLSMAGNTFEQDLQATSVKLKKYFYALRPLLAALWITTHRSYPPMTFSRLRTLITDPAWHFAVDELLAIKEKAPEKATITPVPVLQEWIQQTLLSCRQAADAIPAVRRDTTELDIFFRKYISYDHL